MSTMMRQRRHRAMLSLFSRGGSLRFLVVSGLFLQLFACAEIPDLKEELDGSDLVPCDKDAVYCSNNEVTGCIAGALMTLRRCADEGLSCREGPAGANCGGAEESAPSEEPEAEPLEESDGSISSCGIPENGRCVGSFLLRCENDLLTELDCAASGQRCAEDTSVPRCVARPSGEPEEREQPEEICGAVTSAGQCDGERLSVCDQGALLEIDCAAGGGVCIVNQDGQHLCAHIAL